MFSKLHVDISKHVLYRLKWTVSEHIYFCYDQVWSFPIIDGRYSTTSTYETRIRDERSSVALAARQGAIPVSKDLSSFVLLLLLLLLLLIYVFLFVYTLNYWESAKCNDRVLNPKLPSGLGVFQHPGRLQLSSLHWIFPHWPKIRE